MKAIGLDHSIGQCTDVSKENYSGTGPTAAKSNDITAIPQVLRLVDVPDAIITIDAL